MARSSSLNPRIIIREYDDGDLDAVIAVARDLQIHELQYFDRLKPPEQINAAYIEEAKQDVIKHSGRFLVATIENRVIGYVTLLLVVSSFEQNSEELTYTYSSIGDLAVVMDQRGRGVGQLLMAESERYARESGQKWLRLSVLAKNQTARHFYKNFGLEEHIIRLEKKL
jgi:ribosomal protein S18 acetylase RimI-like enzyme